jgi:histidyl-tRNA synthetase
MGMERLLATLEDRGCSLPGVEPLDLFIATIGPRAKKEAVVQAHRVREAGVSCDLDYLDRSLRAQLRYADRYPCRFVVVLGDNELESGRVEIKKMKTGEETEVDLAELPAEMECRV